MKILAINQYKYNYNLPNKNEQAQTEKATLTCSEKFLKLDKIPFLGVIYTSQKFEQEYPKSFFNKILAEGVPCAYTGIEMISRGEIDKLASSGVFEKPSGESIPYISKYKQSLFDTEKRVLSYLEKESHIHPELNIQQLLQLKYPDAEKALISRQATVLNKINIMARDLPEKEFIKVRELVNKSFDLIFQQNPTPESRFRRKGFLYELDKIKFSDEGVKNKFLKIAEKLPQSSDSVNSFIVKYSQPYKVKYDEYGNVIKYPRNSEEIGKRLLYPSVASDEHIYPQKLYKQEEIARQCGDIYAQKLSDLRVTILTTAYINTLKSDSLIDNFIHTNKYDIRKNIQKHIDRLIEIDKKWLKDGRIEDANKLANYIVLLKEEFERRSEITRPDINFFETYNKPQIEKAYKKYLERRKNKEI